MNNEMLSEQVTEQPWWCVRPQLVATLAALTAICVALWTDTPVRKWMERQVLETEVPEVLVFVKAGE